MKIPEKIRIGGVDYAVVFEERLIDDKGQALFGQIDYSAAEIKLEPRAQSIQGQKQTLLHEVMHGIEHHFKMELTEEQIDNMANGIYMVLMDNPDMFKQDE